MSSNNIQIHPSTNIEKDRADNTLLNQIIFTAQIEKTFRTVSNTIFGLENNPAVSIVGPYGSGKSTTAIALYHYLINELPISIISLMNKVGIPVIENPFNQKEVILITGVRTSFEKHLKSYFNTKKDIAQYIENDVIQRNKRCVIIIDEFGKYLEYASDNPNSGDVYLLQQLAELSHRSSGKFILITIRHQALQAYLDGLRQKYLIEWKKIQGRFYDIVHSNTFNETLALIENMWPKLPYSEPSVTTPNYILDVLKHNREIGNLVNSKFLMSCFPFHPFTLLIAISAYKRFAQNERSLFSFLLSHEKHAVTEYLSESNKHHSYELADFYDFLRLNMVHYISESDFSSDWDTIEISISQFNSNTLGIKPVEHKKYIRILKSIGMLNLFGRDVGLIASKKMVLASNSGNVGRKQSNISTTEIDYLLKHNIINYRRHSNSYYLWHGTDINIHELIEESVINTKRTKDLSGPLQINFPPDSIVAKKHYIQTGTFRYANWQFCSIDELISIKSSDYNYSSDGMILCLIARNYTDRNKYLSKLVEFKCPRRIMPVVLNISKKSEDNIRTYIAIANILRHNQEVNKDRYARRELKSLQLVYERKLDNLIKNHKAYKNKILVVEDGRYSEIQWTNFNSMVSKWFDTLYNKTPIIHNELINRNSPSNSATVGLKKLLYSLVKNPNKDVFGIDTSGPERSIYMNIFSQTNIHGKLGDKYAFFAPKVHGLDSLWNKWDELLHTTIGHNTRIAFSELENLATLPPWGIKRGLAKILLIVKIFMLSDRLSLYKYKSNIGQYIFLPRMYNDTIDLLIRRPDLFYVKYVETKGIHQNLYSKLHAILVGETVKENATLLDAVKPLMEFTNRLSAHTKNTNRVGPTGKKVIGVILKAVSPEDLVYKELPEVLGMKPIYDNINSEIVDDYLKRIENVYYKIRECEDTLNDEIILRLIKFWNLKENSTLESLKNQLQQQFSKDVVSLITDYRLKIFSERILDNNRTGIEWLESISSHIVGKMPNNWLDSDFLSFTDQLQLMYLQVAEIKILAKRKVALEKKNEYPGKIEKELISYINDLNVPKEEIESALFNLLSRLDEEYQKKN